jgi:acyl carrier protein
MSTSEDLIRIIAKITHTNVTELSPVTLLKNVKADSLHWVQIVVSAETQFGVEIDIEMMKTFQTIGDFGAYIDKLKAPTA